MSGRPPTGDVPAAPAVARAATKADAEAVTALVNLLAERDVGARETVDDVRGWFDLPNVQAVVVEQAGRVVGYGDVASEDAGSRHWLDLRIDPAHPEAAACVLAELERRVGGGLLRASVSGRDDVVRGAVEAAGYRTVRHSYTMRIELDEAPAPASWPDGVEVRSMAGDDDVRRAYDTYVESFADAWDFNAEPYEEFRRWQVEQEHFDPSLWFLAEDGGELAGISLCRLRADTGWVSMLGVRRPWRRRGLGEALLRHSFARLYGHGMHAVELGVDAESPTGAVRLYERAGMHVARRRETWERNV